MFENRTKGAHLAKRVSYVYLVFAAILLIAGFVLVEYPSFILSGILCIIMFVAVYLLSTRYAKNRNTWIFLIICAIITVIVNQKILGIVLALLLLVSANDMRKELDN